MAQKQYEHQIDLVIAPSIGDPGAGHVAFGAMVDGVYMRLPAGLAKRLLSVLDIGSVVEAHLGNPGADGMVLKSTAAGVRSWGAIPASGVISFNTRTGAVTLTKADVEAVLTGLINSHSHNYDNYSSWSLYVDGSYVKAVYSANSVNYQGSGGVSVSYSGGTVHFSLTPAYQDIMIDGLQMYRAGLNDPTIYSASGLRIPIFSGSALNELFFNITIPENYIDGTAIMPIIHWMPMTSPALSWSVVWQLEYEWVNYDAVLTGTPTLMQTMHMTGTVGFKHFKHNTLSITGTGKAKGSVLMCRLFRDPANASDQYAGSAGLISAGFRVQVNSLGS